MPTQVRHALTSCAQVEGNGHEGHVGRSFSLRSGLRPERRYAQVGEWRTADKMPQASAVRNGALTTIPCHRGACTDMAPDELRNRAVTCPSGRGGSSADRAHRPG